MKTLAFIVPCWQRYELTRICLTDLARVCDALSTHDIDATAIVVANDENYRSARAQGFGAVKRSNKGLGGKYNDGIQFAAHLGYEYVVPLGSDNLIDPEVIAASVPEGEQIAVFTRTFIVSDKGTRGSRQLVDYPGGVGIRIYPVPIFEPCEYRPAESERMRALDTSITNTLRRIYGGKAPFVNADKHQYQIVGCKTSAALNGYSAVSKRFGTGETRRPFSILRKHYCAETVDALQDFYANERSVSTHA